MIEILVYPQFFSLPILWIFAIAIGGACAILHDRGLASLRRPWPWVIIPLYALALSFWFHQMMASMNLGHYSLGMAFLMVYLPCFVFAALTILGAWLIASLLLRMQSICMKAVHRKIPLVEIMMILALGVGWWVFEVLPMTHVGKLLVTATADCILIVNDDPQGRASSQEKVLVVDEGFKFVKCLGPANSNLIAISMVTVPGGGEARVKLSLMDSRSIVTEPSRYAETEQGQVNDNETRLQWNQKDNEARVLWAGAQRYCLEMGNGWRLPNFGELQSLLDRSGSMTTKCGASTCFISPLFHLTGPELWSSQRYADYVVVGTFERQDGGVIHTSPRVPAARTLCVRNQVVRH